jgi:hypothetical protein
MAELSLRTKWGLRSLAVLAAAIAVTSMATVTLAGSRDQRWIGVMSGYQSQSWYATATGNHSLTRFTCSSNYPSTWTSFRLYHQRGGLPDEAKGPMIYRKTCNGTNVSGSAYSNDTENHYSRLFNNEYNSQTTSATTRQYYPG